MINSRTGRTKHVTLFATNVRFIAPLILGGVILAGCQTTTTAPQPTSTSEAPVTSSLAPMERPPLDQVASTVVWLVDGKTEQRSELIAKTDSSTSWKEDNGCSYTLPTTGFAPATKFENCDGNTGSQDVTLVSGSPWPLSVGKTWSYAVKGKNTRGNTWQNNRRCEVEEETRVTVPMGTYDTFKVVCHDPARIRTYFVSPEVQKTVIFIRHDKRRNQTMRQEMVRFELDET